MITIGETLMQMIQDPTMATKSSFCQKHQMLQAPLNKIRSLYPEMDPLEVVKRPAARARANASLPIKSEKEAH